ncbi:polyprenyl diphosphate synthase [Streptomyces spectabilis]|uniref:polyprenyl diphosphate synthase n=1 Tax=Streptomyces spectabilis TaxID=68270 RepID=UPI0033CFABBD
MAASDTRTEPRQAHAAAAVSGKTPRHVAFILDGNRRWARHHGLSVDEGHRVGLGKVPEVLEWCEEYGIEVATVWLLAVRNLQRDAAELKGLFTVCEDVVRELIERRRWRVRPMGFLDLLPNRVAEACREAEAATASLAGLQANLAIAYDGRAEIEAGVRTLVAEMVRSHESIETGVTSQRIAESLFTRGLPDPDLVIRTSGEQRTSGFLIWQAAQAEWFFSPLYWPDFSRAHFHEALNAYAARSRRLGC